MAARGFGFGIVPQGRKYVIARSPCTCKYEACTGDLGANIPSILQRSVRVGAYLRSSSTFLDAFDPHVMECGDMIYETLARFECRPRFCMWRWREEVSIDLAVSVAVCRDVLFPSRLEMLGVV